MKNNYHNIGDIALIIMVFLSLGSCKNETSKSNENKEDETYTEKTICGRKLAFSESLGLTEREYKTFEPDNNCCLLFENGEGILLFISCESKIKKKEVEKNIKIRQLNQRVAQGKTTFSPISIVKFSDRKFCHYRSTSIEYKESDTSKIRKVDLSSTYLMIPEFNGKRLVFEIDYDGQSLKDSVVIDEFAESFFESMGF